MRVLVLTWEYPPQVTGGLGRHVAELTPALVRQGAEIHVVTVAPHPQTATTTVENGVIIHRVFAPIFGTDKCDIYHQAMAVNKIIETYAKQLADTVGPFRLIHNHDWLTGFAAINLKRMWACPLMVTIHATEQGRNRGYVWNDLQRAISEAERELVTESGHVVVCSRAMKQELQRLFNMPAQKLSVVPNGVDITTLRNGYNRQELAAFRENFVSPNEAIVFSISRLVYEKGIHLLIQAAPTVLADHPQTRFVIAGAGPEMNNLRQQADILGVSDKIDFVGFISDETRNHLYKVANCAVFPSLYEPFGIVALEAMALGCPVVVSDVGGFPETVTHEETGITIYPDSADSVAWGILHLLNNPNLAQTYIAQARDRVNQLFNWSRIASLTLDIYQHVAPL